MTTEITKKTITIKEDVLSTLTLTVSQNIYALDAVIKMNDEEMLEYLSKLEQFQFIKDALNAKPIQELIQDIKIKELISINKSGVQIHCEQLKEAYEILSKALEQN